MHGRRDSSSTIWRTVVFAGAMLGCGGPGSSSPSAATTTPQNTAPTTQPAPTADPVVTHPNTQNVIATPPTDTTNANATPPKPGFKPNGDPCDGVIIPPQQPQPNPDPLDEDAQSSKGKKRPRGGGDRPVGRGFVLA